MIQKICPFCKLDSYSAYNDPNWRCPYCGRIIGDSKYKELLWSKKKKLSAINNRQYIKDVNRIQHLRVINYNSDNSLDCEKSVL